MDKYDEHIQQLLEYPEIIGRDWYAAKGLFQFCSPSGEHESESHQNYGCITMIRQSKNYNAHTTDLTNEIRADERIPSDIDFSDRGSKITRDVLQVFAEWQRRLDKEIRSVACQSTK